MKQLLVFTGLIIFLCACNGNQETGNGKAEKEGAQFGAQINQEGSIPMKELINAMDGKQEMKTKIEGKITECCQKKGCWMNIDRGDGSVMKVTFKDYGFFVPKDCAGKTAIMQGRAYRDTISVELLRHYAEDAGKTPEEIAKINQPSAELTFEAEGVIIK